MTRHKRQGSPGSRRCGAAAFAASFGRKPYGAASCRARLPRHRPQPVPACPAAAPATPQGQAVTARADCADRRKGHSHRARNAAHCPGRPLQRQGHPKIVTATVDRDGGYLPDPAAFAVAAEQAAARRNASIMSAHTAEQIISVVTVETADRPAAVAVALTVVSEALTPSDH